MKNVIVVLWQVVTYFLVGIPLRIIFRVKRSGKVTVKRGKSYIIAANHPTRIDPFLVSYALPFREFLKIVPLRFITAEKYMKNPFMRYFLMLYGSISTEPKKGEPVLKRAKELLSKGETIFIFPSGRLERGNHPLELKVGVTYLEREVKRSVILPVKISFTEKISFLALLQRRLTCNIAFRPPFRHIHFPGDLLPLTQETYDRIVGAATIQEPQTSHTR